MNKLVKANRGKDLPAVNEQITIRNRKILLEYMSGRQPGTIAIRFGVTTEEIEDCVRCALDDIQASELHKDIRGQLALNIMADLAKLQEWQDQLQVTYKRNFQTVKVDGTVADLTEDTNDKTTFIRYEAEKRAKYDLLRKVLGADLPDEVESGKNKAHEKILDILMESVKGNIEKKKIKMEATEKEDENEIIEGEIIN